MCRHLVCTPRSYVSNKAFRKLLLSKLYHKNVVCVVADEFHCNVRGGSRNFRKGGPEAKSLKGGAEIRLFSAAFSHFLINLLQIFQQKGGGGGGAVRPLP